MKRIALVVLLLVAVGFASAQETQAAKHCIMIRPLATVVSGILGVTDIMIDIEDTLSKDFMLNGVFEFGYYNGFTAGMINLGASYNFMGTYLTGLYIGAYPGFGMVNDSDPDFIFDILFEAGYQHVLKNRLILNVYLGYQLMEDNSGPKAGIKIGYAYS